MYKRQLLKYDLREDDAQTMVRFLSGLNENMAHVVELHPYAVLDELSSLAHKVEQHRKTRGKDDGGPSKTMTLTQSTNSQRSNFKSRVKDWVKLFLAQEELKSVWPNSVSPGFVT